MSEKILIGLSGGKDSERALKILKLAKFEVYALTLLFNKFSENDMKNIKNSKKICEMEKVKHFVIDVSSEFEGEIISYFIEEYKRGRTPSPCILCNEKIKFKYLTYFADSLKIPFIATGHYADIYYNLKQKRFILKKSLDERKDQTYFLHRLSQNTLSRTIFPLSKTVKIKEKNYHESQEICFIRGINYRDFLKERGILEKGGNFIYKGEVVGKHSGISNYTVGQRRKLGISVGKPLYVKKIDPEKNIITLDDRDKIFSQEFTIKNCNWIYWEMPPEKFNCLIKIRSQFMEKKGSVEKLSQDRYKIKFNEPQPAITPGQAAVLYNNHGEVLGGGWIE